MRMSCGVRLARAFLVVLMLSLAVANDDCAAQTECAGCIAASCQWCADTVSQCVASAHGLTCGRVHNASTGCSDCAQPACATCATTAECGWCASAALCVEGLPGTPFTDARACGAYVFDNATLCPPQPTPAPTLAPTPSPTTQPCETFVTCDACVQSEKVCTWDDDYGTCTPVGPNNPLKLNTQCLNSCTDLLHQRCVNGYHCSCIWCGFPDDGVCYRAFSAEIQKECNHSQYPDHGEYNCNHHDWDFDIPNSNQTTNLGIVVGSAVAGFVGLVVVLAAGYHYLKNTRKASYHNLNLVGQDEEDLRPRQQSDREVP